MPAGREMPMFPLGTVLFPYADLSLHVFEPRYQVLVRHVLAGEREFGVVLIERGHEVGGGDSRFAVGTTASVVRVEELTGGRWWLAAVGLQRIRVARWLDDDPYPRAVVEPCSEVPASSEQVEMARRRLEEALAELYALVRSREPRFVPPEPLAEDPIRAAFEAAAIAPLGSLDAQRVLEIDDPVERLGLVADLVRGQVELLGAALE